MIRARCDALGDFTLGYEQVQLFHCVTDGRLHCVFRCVCGELKVLWLVPQIYAQLACVIVPCEWTLPSELFEPHPTLPAFTVLDLLEWHFELDRVVTIADCIR